MDRPARPLLRYFGGKFRMAPWVLSHFPRHDIYVEPYLGAGSVFLAKPPAKFSETLNDLDGEIVNLFRVLRGPDARQLIGQIALTPYSRAEFELAFEPSDCPVERARRLIVRSHMAHGTMATQTNQRRAFRIDGLAGKTAHAREWLDMPEALAAAVMRVSRATIERREAVELIREFDDPKALIYADPPYMHETRSAKRHGAGLYHGYAHELDENGHRRLLDALMASRAMVVLSGYPTPLYRALLEGWREVRRPTLAHRQVERVECLWLNPACQSALESGPLFAEAMA